MSLSELLKSLAEQKCYPCIGYRGGGTWRAHVNGAGNHWADATTPRLALEKAIRLWERAKKPMDGYAASPEGLC